MGNIIDFLTKINIRDEKMFKYIMKSIWIFLLLLAGYIYYVYNLFFKEDKTLFIIQIVILIVCLLFGFHFFFYFNFYESTIMDLLLKINPQIKNPEE